MKRLILGILLAAAFIAPAQAEIETFASYRSTTSARDLNFVADPAGYGGSLYTSGNGSGSASSPGKSSVAFDFLDSALGISPLTASFVMSANTSNQGSTLASNGFAQDGFNGYFEYRYTGANSFTANGTTYGTNALLLRGDFTNGVLVGTQGSSSGILFDATPDNGLISYSSDILGFGGTDRDFSFGLTSATPNLKMTSGDLSSFSAVSTGSFSADVISAAPEPMTWFLMIAGFGTIGATLRRRRKPAFTLVQAG